MEYAKIRVLPETPPGGLTAGIDWASTEHVVCVVDAAARPRTRFTAAHSKAGINGLIDRLRRAGVGEVAIERGDGVLVDALIVADLTVRRRQGRPFRRVRAR
jgi:hypothetical protein